MFIKATYKKIIFFLFIFLFGCIDKDDKADILESIKYSTIYEVNLRQYTPSGSIKEFRSHLPRLKSMGINILWFMPIHPIGEVNRKGSLGSYYSVKDYFDINPEFGTLNEFKSLVKEIHKMDMFIILDWVANHTAWDNQISKEHPDWYTRDEQGLFQPPAGTDWSDVIDLNYNQISLQDYMFSAMEYWVKEFNIDGFRCDVASMVPIKFWEKSVSKLQKIKPVFMLAESDDPKLVEQAFHADYNWKLYHILKDIASGKKEIGSIKRYYETLPSIYQESALKMNFLDNHDENSWGRIMTSHFGENIYPLMTLIFSLPGIPMLYSSQESKLDKQLQFFEKDTIEWNHFPDSLFYKKLIHIRKTHPVFWSDNFSIQFLDNLERGLLGFKRSKGNKNYFIILNLSKEPKRLNFKAKLKDILLIDKLSDETTLYPSGYIIFKS
jgi:glycosidase